jgi:protein involved in polysaccharide export with SLBB domain
MSSPRSIGANSLPLEYRANVARKPPIDLSVLKRRSINSDLIYPGDVLDVTLISGAQETIPEAVPYHVDEQGNLPLPIIGPVQVAGFPASEAERLIREASVERRKYRNLSVSVLIKSRKTDHVTVGGAVEKPGAVELPSAGSDLLAAIVAAGGLSESAGTQIEIRHPALRAEAAQVAYNQGVAPGPQLVRVDLVEAMNGNAGDLRLRDGSVVTVREHVPESVYVMGLVAKPGAITLPKDEPLRVTQAIAEAGGRKLEFADKVQVLRYVEGQPGPLVIDVSFKEAKWNSAANLVLARGDVVMVKETPTTFTVETLRNFFRFGVSSTVF